jgi:hypothetical protein
MLRGAGSKKQTHFAGLVLCFLCSSFRFSSSFEKSWSAPLPDKPSDRGLFGFPEDTGAAPITGAPAAHCFRL